MKVIIYHSWINRIGGVESLTYNLSKALSKFYEVKVLYLNCHAEQLNRILREVDCEKYDPNKTYECDVCICMTSWAGHPETVEAKRYIQMIHANYEMLKHQGHVYKKWHKTTEHLAVSKSVQRIFKKMYGYDAKLMYNILDNRQETKPILKLVSATRLSMEKGYNRMIELALKLKQANVKYRWTIFTDLELYKVPKIDMEEIIYMKPRYDIWDYVKEADYGVQLSDTEGDSYFIKECLYYGTPMIVTNFESAYEVVEDGVNGYILDMKLSNLDIDKIINNIPKFKFEGNCQLKDWTDYLGGAVKQPKRTYKEPEKVKITITESYYDVELLRDVLRNETLEVRQDRAEYLRLRGLAY